jgi:hypothetical protein
LIKKLLLASLGILIIAAMLLITGCQKAPEAPPDTFSTTYYLAEEGRSISISGHSDGMPGEQSEYILHINNKGESWQDEYYILLVDSNSVIKEISHERFIIPGGGGIQKPIMVKYPEGFKGALGLCVIVPQRGSLVTTLSIGVKDAVSTGWPDISAYPGVSQ